MDSFISFFDFSALIDASWFFTELKAAAQNYPTEIRLAEGIIVAGLGITSAVLLMGGLVKRSVGAITGAIVLFLALLLVMSGFSWLNFNTPDWQVAIKSGFMASSLIFVTTRVALARDNILVGLITLLCILGLFGLAGAQLFELGDFTDQSNLALVAAVVVLILFCGITGLRGDPGALRLLPGLTLCGLALAGIAFLGQVTREASGPASWILVLLPFALFAAGTAAAVIASLGLRQRGPKDQYAMAGGLRAARDTDLISDLNDPAVRETDHEPSEPSHDEPRAIEARARDMPITALPEDEPALPQDPPARHIAAPARSDDDIDVTSDEFQLDEIDISQLDALEASHRPGAPSVQQAQTASPDGDASATKSGSDAAPNPGRIGDVKWQSPSSANWPAATNAQQLRWIWSSTGAVNMPQRDIAVFTDLFATNQTQTPPLMAADAPAAAALIMKDAASIRALTSPLSVRAALSPGSLDGFDDKVLGGAQPVDGGFDHICALLSGKTVRLWGQRRINDDGIITQIDGFVESRNTGIREKQQPKPIEVSEDPDRDQILGNPKQAREGKSREIQTQTAHRASGESDHAEMAAALRQGRFCSYFQPIVEIESSQILGFEVLARWHRQGAATPLTAEEFIDQAVALGFEMDITRAILPDAARELKLWQDEAPEAGRFICFNVTAHGLIHDSFVDFISEQIKYHSLSPRSLVIEVTESHALDPKSTALDVAKKLKAAGARLAIDDFGSGFANFDQLSAIDFDIVKTDASLLKQACKDKRAEKVLKNLVEFAHKMSAMSIIEGIENRAHLDVARRVGGRLGQGFYFGRPAPVENGETTSETSQDDPVNYTILR